MEYIDIVSQAKGYTPDIVSRPWLPHQMRLDTYMETYHIVFMRELQRTNYGPRLPDIPTPMPGDHSAWRAYLAATEQHERASKAWITSVERAASAAAIKAAQFEGLPGWRTLRTLIYDRDEGRCAVCGKTVAWDDYQLGHLHDRCAGGLDIPENLVVMCGSCNITFKPVHESIPEALAWCAEQRALGGPLYALLSERHRDFSATVYRSR